MDEDLKNPVDDAVEVHGAPAAPSAEPTVLEVKPPPVDQDQIRKLVSEALSENTELARLRELNKLIIELITTQQGASKAPGPSAETLISMRRTLRQTVLDSYREEYKELSDVWKSLETKAQGTVTIAGIFIAAAFTFAKDLANTRLDYNGKLFLAAAIIFLIPTIILSLLVLRRRTIKWIPAGTDVESWADAIEGVSDEDLADRARRLIDEHSGVWKQTVESTREATAEKEKLLYAAQVLLLFAIGAATVVTLKLLNI
jgi:hypothetical protein